MLEIKAGEYTEILCLFSLFLSFFVSFSVASVPLSLVFRLAGRARTSSFMLVAPYPLAECSGKEGTVGRVDDKKTDIAPNKRSTCEACAKLKEAGRRC